MAGLGALHEHSSNRRGPDGRALAGVSGWWKPPLTRQLGAVMADGIWVET